MTAKRASNYGRNWWLLVAIYTVCILVAGRYGLRVATLTPTAIKKAFVGTGKASKRDMRTRYDEVREFYGWPQLSKALEVNSHVVDAFAIMWVHLQHYNNGRG